MKMKYSIHFQLFTLFYFATLGSCWQFFTSLVDYTLTNSVPDPMHIHSEYKYGDCNRKDKTFYAHAHLDHLQVLGKVIVRGWLDLYRIPTCIIIRGVSFEGDLFRSTAYNFQICVPRITYCHSRRRYKYFYYEWYIPPDLIGGMNWDLYFFGPRSKEWQ